MRVRHTISFRESNGKLFPGFADTMGADWLPADEAFSRLQAGILKPGGLSTLVDQFSESCMAKCFGYCLISLLVMYFINRMSQTVVSTLLCATYGFIFIVLILRTLNAKVTGFTDANGLCVAFGDKSITFANGVKYYFNETRR